MVAKIFGEILRNLRTENGLSQEKLAELCDLHDRYISFLERGMRQPSVTTVIKIAKAFDMSASELIQKLENKIAEAEIDKNK